MRLQLGLFALALLSASPVFAQDWQGAVEARGNYYWEQSTRVIAPEITGEVVTPGDVRLGAHYLVDAITSASQAAGARVDIRFTEVRHDAGLSVGHEFNLGEAHLDLTVGAGFSYEPDYQSVGGNVAATLAINDRNTLLSGSLGYVHDFVGKKLRGANRVGEDGTDLSDRGVVGLLDGLALSLGLSQTLTPNLTLSVGYDVGLVFGYQSNAYRQVNVNGVLLDENHPDFRQRHTVHGRLAYYIEPTHTAVHAMYRAYVDSWDVAALTPEVRIYQEFGDSVMLRMRYRYYTQTRAFFQRQAYTAEDEFWTSDGKMSEFHSQLLGGLVLVHLSFLEDTALDFAWRATFEAGFEYIWNTNSYGNGVVAQTGIRIPFE